MKSNWHNIFSYFISSTLELTSEMSAYLNRIDVYSVLGEEQLIYQGDILTEKNAEKIFPIIMKADTISENAVQELQKLVHLDGEHLVWESCLPKGLKPYYSEIISHYLERIILN